MAIRNASPRSLEGDMTVDEFKEWLKRFDTDRDGRISREELKRAIRSIRGRFSGWKSKRGIKYSDADGNGFIDEDEFDNLVDFAQKSLGLKIVRIVKSYIQPTAQSNAIMNKGVIHFRNSKKTTSAWAPLRYELTETAGETSRGLIQLSSSPAHQLSNNKHVKDRSTQSPPPPCWLTVITLSVAPTPFSLSASYPKLAREFDADRRKWLRSSAESWVNSGLKPWSMRSFEKLLYFDSGFVFLLAGETVRTAHSTPRSSSLMPLLGRACGFFLEGTDEAKLIRSGSFFGSMH
ncbi:hypothetical protein C4D60_Mb06t05540 [Musa balbisiana]|uniref:EF-hand domain-containing protein n=1 Tax=Musa balbisiana TaxID=52838 RepID=A0A4S8IKW1_MUSBA|nr:hypothetical protein C4D60_Mb06t05540 [Musa balbisiana]